MSIFSGWTREDLSLLWNTATGSAGGLLVLAGFGLLVLLVLGLVGLYVTGKVGGFFANVRQEEEDARREEEEAAKMNRLPENEKEDQP